MNKYLSFIGVALLSSHTAANATIINTVIDSSDAIWLVGRTDLTIPDASATWLGGLIRHGGPTPEKRGQVFP